MMEEAQKRAKMPRGSAPILELRSLEQDDATLVPILKKGLRVLDMGCGPGSISKGIIAENLPTYFQRVGFENIAVREAPEIYQKGEPLFLPKIGIWTKVAESRGQQLVQDGYLTEEERLQAIVEYEDWIDAKAERMVMKLKEVRGTKSRTLA